MAARVGEKFGVLATIGGFMLAAGQAHAQWTVEILHPPGYVSSMARTIEDGVVVGEVHGDPGTSGSARRAAIWTDGTAASFAPLHPTGFEQSQCFGLGGGQQVGLATNDSTYEFIRAALWTGTAGSYVDLHPAGSESSWAIDVHGGQQVGHGGAAFTPQAGYWTGTAASFVNLHPAGAVESQARGVYVGNDGAVQTGYVNFGSGNQAVLWRGDVASMVNLHPAQASRSFTDAVHGDRQVGLIIPEGGSDLHAALWRGTADSFVDLNPAWAERSQAFDVWSDARGSWQGGFAGGSQIRAAVWSDTAESWEDLHEVLPAEFESSLVYGLWSDHERLYAVGWGSVSLFGRRALLWSRPLPCRADIDGDGELTLFDFLAFQNLFDAGDPLADFDGDGELTIFDFLTYQNAFSAGCE